MKRNYVVALVFLISMISVTAAAQKDSTKVKTDSIVGIKTTGDSTTPEKPVADTAAVAATPMNCYKQWLDYFTNLGTKTMADGMQEVVIAFKSKESCHCYMGKVEVAGGKIKAPLYVQTEGGDYKTFTALGKKLDSEFVAAQGENLWSIANGMSVLFRTTDDEYGRIFFYKSLNKNKQMNKEAPSPSDLLKN